MTPNPISGKLFHSGLEDAAINNVAKKAEEQEMKFSDFHKRYANDPQETDWFIKQVKKQASYLVHQLKQPIIDDWKAHTDLEGPKVSKKSPLRQNRL